MWTRAGRRRCRVQDVRGECGTAVSGEPRSIHGCNLDSAATSMLRLHGSTTQWEPAMVLARRRPKGA